MSSVIVGITASLFSFVLILFAMSVKKRVGDKVEDKEMTISERLLGDPVIDLLRTDLRKAIDGMNMYQRESEKWLQAYRDELFAHNETRLEFNTRLRKVEGEVKTLRVIVDKMDGKQLIRDDNNNITNIRLVR